MQKIKHDKEIKEIESFYKERMSKISRNQSRNNYTPNKNLSREKINKTNEDIYKTKSNVKLILINRMNFQLM